jgi:hypothetical protein
VEAKMPIAPSQLPTPAVSWLVGSSPFSVEVGVGPDSILRSFGSSILFVLSRVVFSFAIKWRSFLFVAESSSLLHLKKYLGTRSDKLSREIDAQPPPEGEIEHRVDSCAAAS